MSNSQLENRITSLETSVTQLINLLRETLPPKIEALETAATAFQISVNDKFVSVGDKFSGIELMLNKINNKVENNAKKLRGISKDHIWLFNMLDIRTLNTNLRVNMIDSHLGIDSTTSAQW